MFRIVFFGLTLLLCEHLGAQELCQYKQNKTIPLAIEEPVLRALSYYPELKETSIQFVFTDKLKKSIMAARPIVGSLFKKQENRKYKVLINPAFKLDYGAESITRIPDSVMIGWLGHELGHIMDYERRSTLGIIGMGISYSLSRNYVRKAERVADGNAVNRRMGAYLIAKKSFILHHPELPQGYRDKIEALYPSPDDISKLIADLDAENSVYEGEEETSEESIPGIS
ncbi:hypothetical protein [Parapedobacter soli]|uniref:hypothetical protein n=1 Tax=Parapedobacter soli TaxID=416955 RepID=UPI0021C93AA3|nr:hypothetical protein [Parapedobacter soli]